MTFLMPEAIQRLMAGDEVKWITADHQMTSIENVVFADSTAGAIALVLPSLIDGAGKFFFVQAPVGVTNAVTVTDKETGSTIGLLDANNDHQLLFSSGIAWIVVFDGIAP